MTERQDGAVRLVVGVGARRGVAYAELAETLAAALGAGGLDPGRVVAVATVAAKGDEPAVRELAAGLGAELALYSADALAAVPVPHPSAAVDAAVGTPSVAEAAALAAASGGPLLITKTRSGRRPSLCTIAIARHRVGGIAT